MKKYNYHEDAIAVEHKVCNALGCERFDFFGIADADFIQDHPCAAMMCCLTHLAVNATDEKKNDIKRFINCYQDYLNMDIQSIFESEPTGEEMWNRMYNDFLNIVKR